VEEKAFVNVEDMTLGSLFLHLSSPDRRRALEQIRQAEALVFKPGDIVALETKHPITAEEARHIQDVFEGRGLEVVIIGPDFKIARQRVPADD
jgi:hypothetical protein